MYIEIFIKFDYLLKNLYLQNSKFSCPSNSNVLHNIFHILTYSLQ